MYVRRSAPSELPKCSTLKWQSLFLFDVCASSPRKARSAFTHDWQYIPDTQHYSIVVCIVFRAGRVGVGSFMMRVIYNHRRGQFEIVWLVGHRKELLNYVLWWVFDRQQHPNHNDRTATNQPPFPYIFLPYLWRPTIAHISVSVPIYCAW